MPSNLSHMIYTHMFTALPAAPADGRSIGTLMLLPRMLQPSHKLCTHWCCMRAAGELMLHLANLEVCTLACKSCLLQVGSDTVDLISVLTTASELASGLAGLHGSGFVHGSLVGSKCVAHDSRPALASGPCYSARQLGCIHPSRPTQAHRQLQG